ncbi:unnamed protein product [Parnassius apollo]|uniref:(apollo) hypothetical protein n=1 Tax=Parnassius apollo TaxID=110799 RepID=A0A8S3X5T0_PARAO|nr:unnamed protein product [Parnassius apollo]
MSRKRAKYLVDLAKKEKNSLRSFDKNVVSNDTSDSIDNTPVPSSYSDFSESSQSLNGTLVPTSRQETEDHTRNQYVRPGYDYSVVSTPKNNKRRSKQRTEVDLKRHKLEDNLCSKMSGYVERENVCVTMELSILRQKGKLKHQEALKNLLTTEYDENNVSDDEV